MSTARKEKRGKLKTIWNDTFKTFQSYRLSSRGKWIMINNNSAPHLTKHQMNKLTSNI